MAPPKCNSIIWDSFLQQKCNVSRAFPPFRDNCTLWTKKPFPPNPSFWAECRTVRDSALWAETVATCHDRTMIPTWSPHDHHLFTPIKRCAWTECTMGPQQVDSWSSPCIHARHVALPVGATVNALVNRPLDHAQTGVAIGDTVHKLWYAGIHCAPVLPRVRVKRKPCGNHGSWSPH